MSKAQKIAIFFLFMAIGPLFSQSPEETVIAICKSAHIKLEPLGLNGAFKTEIIKYKKNNSTKDNKTIYKMLAERAFAESKLYRLCSRYEMDLLEKAQLESIATEVEKLLLEVRHKGAAKSLTKHYLKKENYEAAKNTCQALLAIDPNSITGNEVMGRIFEKAQITDVAISYLETAANSGSLHALYQVGKLFCETGNADRGIAFLKKAAESSEQGHLTGARAKTYLWKFLSKPAKGQVDTETQLNAELYLQQAANAKNPDPEAQVALGRLLYYKKKRINQGTALLEKARRGGDAEALSTLKEMYLAQAFFSKNLNEGETQKLIQQGVDIIKETIINSSSEYKSAEDYKHLLELKKLPIAHDIASIAHSEILWDQYQGSGEEHYLNEAIQTLEGLARTPKCHYLLGRYFEEKKNYRRAFEEYQQADTYNYPEASHKMGIIFQNALLGQKKNEDLAKIYLERAALNGFSEAYLSLAYQGIVAEKSAKEALLMKEDAYTFLFDSNDLSSSASSNSTNIASSPHRRASETDLSEPIFQNLLKAANLGNAHAQAKVGYYMAFNSSAASSSNKYKEAFDWLCQAAEKKERSALFNLGNIYRQGLGRKRDIHKALECYLQAASGEKMLRGYNKGIALLACQSIGSVLENDLENPHNALAVFYYEKCLEGIKPFSFLNNSGDRMYVTGMTSMPPLLQQAGARSAAALGHMHFYKKDYPQAKKFYENAILLCATDEALQQELRTIHINYDITNMVMANMERKELVRRQRLNARNESKDSDTPSPESSTTSSSSLLAISLEHSSEDDRANGRMQAAAPEASASPREAQSEYERIDSFALEEGYSRMSTPILKKVNTQNSLKHKKSSFFYVDPQGNQPDAPATIQKLSIGAHQASNENRSSINLTSARGYSHEENSRNRRQLED